MNLKPFKGSGSTPSRRAFWDTVTQAVIASQKVAGQNVTVDEHPRMGTIINIPDSHRGQGTGTGTGACCTDGECSILSESDCIDGGGNFLGNGTTCDDVDCTMGACCLDGDCTITTPDGCAGTYQGDGTTCEDVDCGTATSGACCHSDGSCTIEIPDSCDGTYQGDNTLCEDVTCPPAVTGACCATDGTCSLTTEEDCIVSGGHYQGNGSTCEESTCETGACCVAGTCSQQTEIACGDLGGHFFANGVPCIPDPCPACTECAFLNPCDGLYYRVKTTTASGSVDHEIDHWTFNSTRVDTCSGGFSICSGEGSGSLDDGIPDDFTFTGSCDCGLGETFFGIGGLLWELDGAACTCSICPEEACNPPDSSNCNSFSYDQDCPFGHFSGTVTTFYSEPCDPMV